MASSTEEVSYSQVPACDAGISQQVSTQCQQSKAHSKACLQTIFSWRAVTVLHMHMCVVLFTTLTINMPFALVSMLKQPHRNSSMTGPEITSQRMVTFGFEESENRQNSGTEYDDIPISQFEGGEFEWDSSTQGLLLSSSIMLGWIMPLMTDFFIRKLGGKRLVFWGMLIIACLTLLQPVGARLSPYVLMALRIVIGFFTSIHMSTINEVLSWWAPNNERVTMGSFAFSGGVFASILVSLTSGFLCAIPFDNGWPFIFYVHGALAVVWSIVWQCTGSIKPEDHPYISESERQYIITTRHAMGENQKRTSPPYRQILTCVPVWGCVIMQTVHTYTFYVLASYVPIYLNTIMGFSPPQVGLIASIGYVFRFLGTLAWGQISNLLQNKTRLQTTACRKVVQCTGFYLAAVCLVVLGFVRGQVPAILLLCLVLIFQGSTFASSFLVPLDMAPRYAAFLSGLMMTTNIVVSIPGPIITSFMVQNGTMDEWRNVFISIAAICVVGATCFLTMASSSLQSWGKPGDKEPDD